MENFNTSNLETVRRDINSALEEVQKKHGINIDMGNIRYDNKMFTSKLTVNVVSENIATPYHAAFHRKCYSLGLAPDDLNKTFMYEGKRYKIVGAATGKSKYPVMTRNISDKGDGDQPTNKMLVSLVKNCLR